MVLKMMRIQLDTDAQVFSMDPTYQENFDYFHNSGKILEPLEKSMRWEMQKPSDYRAKNYYMMINSELDNVS